MTNRRVRYVVLAGIPLVLSSFAAAALTPSSERGSTFARSSLTGSGQAVMQLETVPARVSRVAVRPGAGGNEAWALGTSTARKPGWSTASTGQVVFLKYTPGTGWALRGPPVRGDGSIFNPNLSSFDISPAGEGWAVGDGGTMLHKRAGSDEWREAIPVTGVTLTAVSLAPDGGGFAVGVGPAILRLSNGSWVPDSPGPDMSAQATDLQSVAAVSSSEAWTIATGAVSGVDSTSLLIYRRGPSGWSPVKTGQAIFDSPPAKSDDGVLNRGAEAGAVAADARGAWIGGRIHPRSTTFPDGDVSPGDASRAFIVRYDNATQTFTSYCPDQYSERTAGTDLTRLCDEPFPTAPFHVAAISIVPGGDVFAGGLGLFRFTRSGWYREPNASGYIISLSMASNSEGFVASPGRSLGAGGLIRGSSTTVGHWTAHPRASSLARWAQPQDQLLTGIAAANDGTNRAIAVGMDGSASIFSGAAWDSIQSELAYAMNAVAWPPGGMPWAVGQRGFLLHLKGLRWKVVESPTDQSLYGVAFRSADEGVAVGLGGAILSYKGGTWRNDASSAIQKDLYAVVATSTGYVAAGRDGTVIEGNPGSWRVRSNARALTLRPDAGEAPTFYAAAVLEGRVVIGGQDSALIVREPGGQIRVFEQSLEGTVLALGAGGGVLYASVSPNLQKFRGELPTAQRGTLLRLAGGRWADVGLKRHTTLLRDAVDPAEFEDPIYALSITGPEGGWAAGGSPADVKDPSDGQFRSRQTSAVYRIRFDGDPAQPASVAPLDPPGPGVTFAAFGESWCGVGLCSSSVGTGTMSDRVALQIREEINSASRQPGGPRFVLFTGNMRRTGIPEELEQFNRYFTGFEIPVFAALGSQDRFIGVSTQQVIGDSSASTGSGDYWKQAFGMMTAPWGEAESPSNIRPVPFLAATPQPGLARTHYAFDYLERGQPVLRVVVVDSSTRSYGVSEEQNPQEDQDTWLKSVLGLTGTSLGLSFPSVVVMNQPTILPHDQLPNWPIAPRDQQDFESTVAAARVSAVITGGPRLNATDLIKGSVPVFVVGGGGAPLGREVVAQGSASAEPASKLPTDGYYHAWHLLRIPPARPGLLGGGVTVSDQAFPVIESLALHSSHGASIPAGKTTDISAFARGLSGGFSDPDQSLATYLVHGRSLFLCGYKAQGKGACISDAAILPRFRFYSEDPSTADFVQRSGLDVAQPKKVAGALFRDPGGAEGLLCAFKLGRVGINAVAGLHRARIVIDVVPGVGDCVDAEVVAPPDPARPPDEPRPARVEPQRKLFNPTRLRAEAVAIFPPPPAPVVAPAPPGAPGVGKKEEHEYQPETEGHEDMKFTAMVRERRNVYGSESPWPLLGGLSVLSFFAATAAAYARDRSRAQCERTPSVVRWQR